MARQDTKGRDKTHAYAHTHEAHRTPYTSTSHTPYPCMHGIWRRRAGMKQSNRVSEVTRPSRQQRDAAPAGTARARVRGTAYGVPGRVAGGVACGGEPTDEAFRTGYRSGTGKVRAGGPQQARPLESWV